MSAMVNEKERAAQLERLAPKPTAQEMEQVNDLFRHFIFKRSGKGEIWTTCCRRHEFIKDTTDNACELRILDAPHAPERRNNYDNTPDWQRRETCPYCGREVTVKELRYTGGRGNLWSFRRVLLLRRWRGALWATAWSCEKNYGRVENLTGAPLLTGLPEMSLLGVYRFTPGLAESGTRSYWRAHGPLSYTRQTAPGTKSGSKSGLWNIHSPYTYCSELGKSFDIIGQAALGESFMRWCHLEKVRVASDNYIELLTAACFYPRQIEWLVKLGLAEAVGNLASRGVKNAEIIRWNAGKPRDFLRVTKQEVSEVTGDTSCTEPLRALRLCARYRDTAVKMKPEDAMYIVRASVTVDTEKWIVNVVKRFGVSARKMVAYLEKNRSAMQGMQCHHAYHTVTGNEVVRLYKDYLDAAEHCGLDLENPVIQMPRDLPGKHDEVTAAWAAIQEARREAELANGNKERQKRQKKLLAERTEKYEFRTEGWMIRVPKNANEIVAEGKALKHCVGGYADRHLSGATTILFLRRADKPDVPLVTIEMQGNRIIQVHGYRNEWESCPENPERTAARELYRPVLDMWVKWLEAGSKRNEDGSPKLPKKTNKKKSRRNAA